MTVIEFSLGKDACDLKVSGHCKHDVCVSVSALTSALVQFAEEIDRLSDTVDLRVTYERGLTELHMKFGSRDDLVYFVTAIQGIITGYKLFEANFPKEVRYVNA